MRGYDVQGKWYDHDNRNSNEDWLEHHPFSAFIDAKVETVPLGMNAYDVISKALQEYGIGSCIEISNYRKMRDYGHVIVGYNDMGKPRFIDVQEGTTFALEKMHDIRNVSYARTDNLRINELFLADVCEWRPKR